MTELEELRIAYAECSRQRNELLTKEKERARQVPVDIEVVAWQHVFADGRIVSYSEEQAGFPARDDALKVEPLVTLASAQAEGLAYEAHYEGALDRITALESALRVAREALQYSIKQVPELATVPGVSAALALIDTTIGTKT